MIEWYLFICYALFTLTKNSFKFQSQLDRSDLGTGSIEL